MGKPIGATNQTGAGAVSKSLEVWYMIKQKPFVHIEPWFKALIEVYTKELTKQTKHRYMTHHEADEIMRDMLQAGIQSGGMKIYG